MSTQGPKYAIEAGNNLDIGTVEWIDLANAQGGPNEQNPGASCVLGISDKITYYLACTNFAFGIPSAAIIKGITVEFNKRSLTDNPFDCNDNSVKIIVSGTISGDEKADTVTDWNSTDFTFATYGSSADLWGVSFTAANINDSGFGCGLSATGINGSEPSCNGCRITINYDSGPFETMSISTAGQVSIASNSTLKFL